MKYEVTQKMKWRKKWSDAKNEVTIVWSDWENDS